MNDVKVKVKFLFDRIGKSKTLDLCLKDGQEHIIKRRCERKDGTIVNEYCAVRRDGKILYLHGGSIARDIEGEYSAYFAFTADYHPSKRGKYVKPAWVFDNAAFE